MKAKLSVFLLAVGVGAQLLLASGCVNTGKGIQKDYQKAEDKIESIGK